jgi:hypothetical protein
MRTDAPPLWGVNGRLSQWALAHLSDECFKHGLVLAQCFIAERLDVRTDRGLDVCERYLIPIALPNDHAAEPSGYAT